MDGGSINLKDIRKRKTEPSKLNSFVPKPEKIEQKRNQTPQPKSKVVDVSESTLKPSHKKFSLAIIAFVAILTIIGIGYYLIDQSNNFYKGKWDGEISIENAQKGVVKIAYIIEDDLIKEEITATTPDGTESLVKVNYKVQYIAKTSSVAIFSLKSVEFSDANITIPENVCSQAKKSCETLKGEFITNLKSELENQSKALKDADIRIVRRGNTDTYFILGENQFKLTRA